MKTIMATLSLIGSIMLMSCKDDLFGPDLEKNDDFHTHLAAEVPNPDGTGKTKVPERGESLTVVANKPITLKVANSFEDVSHVEWSINGTKIGEGNNLETTQDEIGVHRLLATYRIGKKHYKREIDLYVYVTKRLSFRITPGSAICGQVAIGITQHLENGAQIGPGYSKASVQSICTTGDQKSATVANIEVNFFSDNPKLEIELIEPRVVKSDASNRFCFLIFFCFGGTPDSQLAAAQLYETYRFESGSLKGLKEGIYTNGTCELTIH